MRKTARTLAGKLPFPHSLRGAVAALCWISFLGVAGAAQTWNGNGADPNWSTAGNWSGGTPISGNGTVLLFSGSAGLGPNMDTDFTVKSLTFSAGASSFDLLGAHTLTFDVNSAAGTTLADNAAAAQTIESNIVIADSVAGSSFVVNSGGSLTLNGNVTMTTTTVFQVNTGATTTVKGVMTGTNFSFNSAATTGGTLVLAGTAANANTGNFVVTANNGVTLELNKASGVTALSGSSFFLGATDNLKLDSDDQIAHGMALKLGGNTILMQGHSATAASMTIGGNVLLDFGGGSQVGFTLSLAGTDLAWTSGTLTIDNWNGTDYLRSLTAPQAVFLTNTTFDGYGAGAKATQVTNADGTFYYVTPLAVPEPGQAMLLGLGGALALVARMKVSRTRETV